MKPGRTAAILFAVLLAVTRLAGAQAPERAPTGPAIVVLVRHAEKAAQPAEDPPLTTQGRARAKALAIALRDGGVSATIITQWLRTRETAAPLAAILRTQAQPEVIPTVPGDVPAHARAVAAAVRRHSGEVVLVVGHSNTIPAIIAALGGPRLPDICDSVFDELFVLVPDGKSARLVRSRYGASSSREGCPQ